MKSVVLLCLLVACAADAQPRQRWLMDFDWQFEGRKVDLPHDFMIDGPWAKDNPSGMAGGYAPLGIGTYTKTFPVPAELAGKRVYLEFEGVFNRADVWLNKEKVGHNENGYIGFQCELNPWLRPGRDNTITVRVDNMVQASRWYTGSGIYRHVWMYATEPLHVARFGTYITTPDVNTVKIATTLRNDTDDDRATTLVTRLTAPDGTPAGSAESAVTVAGRGSAVVTQNIAVAHPQLWSLESPRLYHAVSEVDGAAYDSTFGIRTIKWDVNNGFALNGTRVILKGVDLHHDQGALGAAAFDRGWERRIRILQEMGVNAIRLSHNPHAPELLDAADRMGMLLMDEAFDKWAGMLPDGTGWRHDLETQILRDRNHPSVILWSVGNEMTPHMYLHEGALLYRAMADVVHKLDPTRPVTAGLHPARNQKGERDAPLAELAAYMDVISMNYQTRWYARDHVEHPNQVLLGSEVHVHQNELREVHPADSSAGNQWFGTQDYNTNEFYPYVAGQFIWAGFDYLGESARVLWPSKGSRENIILTTGERKPFSHYHESLYSEKSMVWIAVDNPDYPKDKRKYDSHDWLALVSHWNLPADLKTARIYTFTNAPVVELLLNGQSLGEKKLKDFGERIIYWDVPNTPGTLRAVAKREGKVIAMHELKTAGPAVRLLLKPDRAPLDASGQDLSHIEVQAVDAAGIVVPGAANLVHFEVSGGGRIAGVDNGDLDDQSPFKASQRELREGKCLVIVQSGREPGRIKLTARADGIATPATLEIEVNHR